MTQPTGSGMPPLGGTVLAIPPPTPQQNIEIVPAIGEPQLGGENPDLTADYIFCNNLYVNNIFQQGGGVSVSFPLRAPNTVIDPSGYTNVGPPYAFTDQWTGIYSNGLGKIGIGANWADSTSNQMQSILQIQPYTVQGWAANNGGKAISMMRTVGFGWTGSQTDNQTLTDNTWIMFSQGPQAQIVSLAVNDSYYGAGFKIWGQYTRANPGGGGTNDWDLFIDVTQSPTTGVLISTEGAGATNVPLSLLPEGALFLGTGGVQLWNIDPTVNGGRTLRVGNTYDIGQNNTTQCLRTLYTTTVSLVGNSGPSLLGGTGVPAAGLGANGDYYHRLDGGGAGATHLYFKNAGAWLGIA